MIKNALIFCCVFLLFGCQEPNQISSELDKIRQKGVLTIGTLYSPLTYIYGLDEHHTGFDYELAKQFANHLGVKLKVTARYSPLELQPLLAHGSIDIIAAPYSPNFKLHPNVKVSPELYNIDHVIIYRTGYPRPKKLSQVDAPIWAIAGTTQAHILKQLVQANPELPWHITTDADEEELLRKVAENEIQFALVDSANLSLNQRFYPALATAITVKRNDTVHWQLNHKSEDSLQAALVAFIGQQYRSGVMDKLKEKYFGQFDKFDFVDTRQFLRAIKSRLPRYEPLFRKYAGELDWRLLASVSYQESHWKPNATSPTGVRGLMMLTLDTAKHLGIKNRLDPEQSIKGGAKYLQQLLNRLPESIPQDERIWFALASYNIGFGHLMDARRLTKLRGQNPNSWTDVKDTLPLLMQRRWNKKTKYGYARGGEAANYVLNIRQYYQSLTWQDDLRAKEKALEEQNAKFRKLVPPIEMVVPAVDEGIYTEDQPPATGPEE